MQIRIQLFTTMRIRIRILLLIKVMGICDHWSIDTSGLHFEPPGLHCDRPRLGFEHLKLLNYDYNDSAFHSFADPDTDPAAKNNADLARIRTNSQDDTYAWLRAR
jgi:hypothetical protein